jgi:hypothetical protein
MSNFTVPTPIPAPFDNGTNPQSVVPLVICSGPIVLKLIFYISVEVVLTKIFTLILIVAKIFTNREYFVTHKLMLAYFTLLLLGNLFFAIAYILQARNTYNGIFGTDTLRVINLIALIGVLCLDCFFALVPNLFFSIYKTQINAEKANTFYFKINFVVVITFSIITLVINFIPDATLFLITNLFVAIELIYTFSFYLVVLKAVSHLHDKRIYRALKKYFICFFVYGLIMIYRCVMLTYAPWKFQVLGQNVVPLEIVIAGLFGTTLASIAILVATLFFLKELKFREDQKDRKTTASTDGATTASSA